MVSPNFITGDSTCLIINGIALLTISGATPVSTYTEGGVTYSVFSTSVPGIGIIIGIKAMSATHYTPVTSVAIFPANPVPSRGMGIAIQTKFIVTGRLTSGVYHIAEQPLLRVYANGSSMPTDASELILKATTITITAKTCQMSGATTRNVPLSPVGKNQFSGVGSSAGPGYNFSLTTICDSGVKLHATMTDGTNPANTGNILTMGSGATASGVGVQILRNDTPISFGPDSSAPGNTNQWYIGTAGSMDNEPFTIPLKARYLQTEPTLVAGSVKARATVTFSYQ
ncbi:fimbrial protein [Serratia sp. L9]|uniref:fimbrial protein n=1 Tax=Serratia sp. L9 TaxID=3423946 RepID=UPI003D6669B4